MEGKGNDGGFLLQKVSLHFHHRVHSSPQFWASLDPVGQACVAFFALPAMLWAWFTHMARHRLTDTPPEGRFFSQFLNYLSRVL